MGSSFTGIPKGLLTFKLHKNEPAWFSLSPELKYKILQHLFTNLELARTPNPFAVYRVSHDFVDPSLIRAALSLAIWHVNMISRPLVTRRDRDVIEYVDREIQPSKHLICIKQLHISVGIYYHKLHRLPPTSVLRVLPNLRHLTVIKDIGERYLFRAHPVVISSSWEGYCALISAREAGYGWMPILETLLVQRAKWRREVARIIGPYIPCEEARGTFDAWARAVGVDVHVWWEAKLIVQERTTYQESQCIADLELDLGTRQLRVTVDGESAVFEEQNIEEFL